MGKTNMPQFLLTSPFAGSKGEKIAYHKFVASDKHIGAHKSREITLIWCGGLRSDMDGTKALALQDWAQNHNINFIRFDYYGHGQSTGDFKQGTLSRWADDIGAVITGLTDGPVILIGSSMGGWAALLSALAYKERVAALLLIAPAPDFTEKLMWANFDATIRKTIAEKGVYYEPSDYDEPMPISKALIEDGRNRQLLDAPIAYHGPVRILQGMRDEPVPWQHAQKLLGVLESHDVEMTLVKDGDHSLSRPQDIARLETTLKALMVAQGYF